ncbi:MAG: hypothetical protein RDV48_22820 [Candidatus Eremiobacteraeota bacterium]|nr:hypothetical protein [Candidatus Eremiobacteraeota bacterium]
MKTLKAFGALVCLAAALFLSFCGCAKKQEKGTIFFVSTRTGIAQLFSMRADGSRQKRVTNDSFSNEAPWCSPDMKMVAYSSKRGATWDLFVMHTDGSSAVQLTRNSGDNCFPCWSPDGTMIAFQSNRDGLFRIYTMKSDGTGQRALSMPVPKGREPLKKFQYTHPAWVPGGKTLLAVRENGKNGIVVETDMEGKTSLPLTETKALDTWPSFESSGKILLFASNESDVFQIYGKERGEKGKRMVTGAWPGPDNFEPRWSPSGGSIIFTSRHTGTRQIFRMPAGPGGGRSLPTQLTRDKFDNYHPYWGS